MSLRLANRTGRVVALARLLLALFFVLATAQSIDGPLAYPRLTLAIADGYVIYAIVLLAMTWRSWWLDHRLAVPSHLGDVAVFVALDRATGLPVTSPFFIFFVFLVLAAAARWGWRAGLLTGGVVVLLFVSETMAEIASGGALDNEEYLFSVIRGGHLVVLTLMLSWFGATHLLGGLPGRGALREIQPSENPIEPALAYFAGCLGADRSAMVWAAPDGDGVNITRWSRADGLATERAGADEFAWLVAPALQADTFLFDEQRRRTLFLDQDRFRARSGAPALSPELVELLRFSEGIGAPVESRPFRGHIFAGGMDGSAWDDLSIARQAALDIARGFERWETTRAAAKASESDARQRIARNLHDSVQQVMAGIGLKLRGVRMTAPEGAQRDAELKALEDELVVYQRQLSSFIADLRQPGPRDGQVNLRTALNEIAAGIRRQWSVEVVVHGGEDGSIPKLLRDEIAHLLREAAANAARHGQATKLVLSGEISDDRLYLIVQDNGGGFPESGSFNHFGLTQKGSGPRSILERVESFRGTVDLASSEQGATVSILIPLGMIDA